MFVVSSCSCLCPIYRSHVLSWEWRCSWSSADRRCSNYISVINNFIAHKGVTYIRDLTIHVQHCKTNFQILYGDITYIPMWCIYKQSICYRQISNIRHTKFQNFLVSFCLWLCSIYWSQVSSREWRCGWSSVDRNAPTTYEWSKFFLPLRCDW